MFKGNIQKGGNIQKVISNNSGHEAYRYEMLWKISVQQEQTAVFWRIIVEYLMIFLRL